MSELKPNNVINKANKLFLQGKLKDSPIFKNLLEDVRAQKLISTL